MPRKGHTQKRDVLADPMYNSKVVTKLVNSIMLDGKKGVAQKIVYGAFATVEEKTGKPALEVFEEAMLNHIHDIPTLTNHPIWIVISTMNDMFKFFLHRISFFLKR